MTGWTDTALLQTHKKCAFVCMDDGMAATSQATPLAGRLRGVISMADGNRGVMPEDETVAARGSREAVLSVMAE